MVHKIKKIVVEVNKGLTKAEENELMEIWDWDMRNIASYHPKEHEDRRKYLEMKGTEDQLAKLSEKFNEEFG